VIDIPWTLCLFVKVIILVLPRLLHVDEVVCPITQHSANDKRSLPGRGQLVYAFGVLDQPEHDVSFLEFEGMNLVAVIAPQLLLVECCSRQGQLLGLLKKVDIVFVGFFGLLFSVLDHSCRIEFDVIGQHSLYSIDQKEGCEADRVIQGCTQALEY
jgi:hypothetical protein